MSLKKLGLNNYQAKVYTSLVALGPSGATEIHRSSGVPRTKVYEVLEQLFDLGAVEIQSGRPLIYTALIPAVLTDRLKNNTLSASNDVLKLFEEESRQISEAPLNRSIVGVVKGEAAIRRKTAAIISSAKMSVFIIESHPPRLINSTISVIKSAMRRGVGIRAACVLNSEQDFMYEKKSSAKNVIEFRRMSSLDSRRKADRLTEELLIPLKMALSKMYGLVVVDDSEAFAMYPDETDPAKSIGVSIRIPDVPVIQRIIFEELLRRETFRKV